MRASPRTMILLLVLLLGSGMVAAQSQDVQENPPDPGGESGPGGGDDPSPWPMFVSFLSSSPLTFTQGPEEDFRYIQREADGSFTVFLGDGDFVRAGYQDPAASSNLTIQNALPTGSAGEPLEVTWYDENGAMIEGHVLLPGESVGKRLDHWTRVEIRVPAGKGV